ncbi:MAG: hypothetical protein QOD75_121 [Blastocatellia bacterium]|jgi:hypothetical protein|nr:hypothetical protein [Blastocatellia bacterium]
MLKTIAIGACLFLAASNVFSQQKRVKPKPQPIDLSAGFVNDEAPSRAVLEKRIQQLESRVLELQLEMRKDNSAELDTTSDSYQKVNSNNGTFLVSVAKLEPYLNGYKIFLGIGNMTTATFSGFDLSLKWAPKEPAFNDNWLSWHQNKKTKSQHFTQDLLPGRWNQVEVILTPAQAHELGYLEVSIKTNEVILLSSK